MKKLLLFVAAFLIMALPTVAQETDLSEEEFKQKIDSVFEHVDMTSVETGILIEHGFNLLDPNVFNGQKPDSVYSNKEIMKALYAGLYDSRVNDYFSLEDTDSTFSKIDNTKNISILFLAYNRFKDYMFKSGDIYWENGQLNKTDNSRWENLFDYDFCFAVALGEDEFVGKDVTIPINVDNLLNNTMSRISQIDVKADDGTYEKVALNTDWKHTFSQLGEHWLTFRVLFYDGFLMECRTPIMLLEQNSQHLPPMDKPIETFADIAADEEQSGGELQVIYLNKEKTSGKFIRPLVIAGDINLSGLLTGNASTSFDLKTIASGSIGTKINELSQIYDIIYLKYNNDTDDLLRNGKLLRKALQIVNNNRFSVSDDTYVVGLGVGGVIARIGINMMESEGENHRVCKFIAVNSPFRGVNIPLALQGLIRHIQNLPRKVKRRIPEIIQRANLIENHMQNDMLKSLVIQRLNENNECTNSLNANWLNVNDSYLVKPKNCKSVSIVSLTSAQKSEKLFEINGKYHIPFGNFKAHINGYPTNSISQIYKGKTKVSIIGIGKEREFSITGNNSVLPLDQDAGQKISISSLKNLTSLFTIAVYTPNVTYVPCYSAFDMTKSDFDAITDLDNITTSKFDKCKVVYSDCSYPDYSPMLPALAYELIPHIEGQTSDVLGTTELTLTNIPNFSFIKYEWSSKLGNFKVVSSSKNKVVLTPTKYSITNRKILDKITVTPKVQLINIPEIENLSASITTSAAYLSVNGNNYISPELNVYSLSRIPDDVTAVEWTASKGVELTPYEDMTVGATVKKATADRWIQASFTSYGVTHDIRKSLKVATLDSVCLRMMKHWRNKQEQLDKYYFHIDIYPPSSIDEMTFCWYNTVCIKKTEESNNGTIDGPIGGGTVNRINGEATIKTDGDVGSCRFDKDFPVIGPIFPTGPLAINDLPEIPVEPFLMGKNEAIVSMPKIGVDEVAEGDVYCDVKDKFGTKYTVHYPVESHYAVIYCVAPNPADAVITIAKVIDGENNGISTCSLDSVTARLYNEQALVREQTTDGNCRIDVSDLPDGTYFLVVTENGEMVLRQTVIIKH
uniref:T9SS type A sorting domain-containing protein n=1 Tax=Candidatus Limisoma sp. TaxID=3076476 RepID=UPI003FF0401E